jgi:hypothetical protein
MEHAVHDLSTDNSDRSARTVVTSQHQFAVDWAIADEPVTPPLVLNVDSATTPPALGAEGQVEHLFTFVGEDDG